MRRHTIVERRRRGLGSALRLAGLALAGALLLIPADAYAKDSKTISQKSSGSSKSSGSYSKSTSGSRATGSRATGSQATGSRSSASSSRATSPSRSRSSARPGSATSSGTERRTLFGRREARRPVRQNDGEQPATTVTGSGNSGSSTTGSSSSHYGPTRHHGYYGGYYGYHHYYYPYRHFYGYYPYFYGPYGHYYPYRRSYREDMGALDLNVKPKKTRVYIDGTPVGPVDRYDGFPSYLWLEAGTYDLAFYLEGHQTLHRTYTVYPGVIADVDERMQPGTAVEPEPPAPAAVASGDESRYGSYGSDPPRGRAAGDTGIGRLQLSVKPGDAAVYLDGHFLGTGEELSQLSAGVIVEPGRHVLELVRPGYQSREVPIRISAGERLDLDFELEQR